MKDVCGGGSLQDIIRHPTNIFAPFLIIMELKSNCAITRCQFLAETYYKFVRDQGSEFYEAGQEEGSECVPDIEI